MTDDTITLRELMDKGPDATLLREMIGRRAASDGTGDRTSCVLATASAARIGRTCATATGIATGRHVLGPWSRAYRSYAAAATFPAFWSRAGRRRRRDRGGSEVLRPGHPTRSVDEPVKAMGLEGISKSQVSRPCRDRRAGGDVPAPSDRRRVAVPAADATDVKARRDHHIVSVAVMRHGAASTDGCREVLGTTIGNSEPSRLDRVPALAHARWPRGVKLVISDAHEGLKQPIAKCLARPGSAVACTPAQRPGACRKDAATDRLGVDRHGVRQDEAEAARQWRQVADQARPRISSSPP